MLCRFVVYIFEGICSHVIPQNAQSNGFVGSLHEHMSIKLGFLHGSYGALSIFYISDFLFIVPIVIPGLGAFVAPFASTFFSGYTDRRWAFHFILSAGLCLSNIAVLLFVFRLRRQESKFKSF